MNLLPSWAAFAAVAIVVLALAGFFLSEWISARRRRRKDHEP